MSLLIVCFTHSFQDSCNLYCFRTSGSQYEVGRRCDWITIGSFWFGGDSTKPIPSLAVNLILTRKGSFLMEASPAGTWLLKCIVYTLHRQGTSLWLTSWIPSKRPLHHSRKEQWRPGVQWILLWILFASGAFSLYPDSQDGGGLEGTRGECQFSSVQLSSVQSSSWGVKS